MDGGNYAQSGTKFGMKIRGAIKSAGEITESSARAREGKFPRTFHSSPGQPPPEGLIFGHCSLNRRRFRPRCGQERQPVSQGVLFRRPRKSDPLPLPSDGPKYRATPARAGGRASPGARKPACPQTRRRSGRLRVPGVKGSSTITGSSAGKQARKSSMTNPQWRERDRRNGRRY